MDLLPAQGPLGPVQIDSGIQGPLSTPEAGGNLSREPGSCKSFPLTPETLDHLRSAEGPDDLSISAHEMFDSLPSTQGTLGILVYFQGSWNHQNQNIGTWACVICGKRWRNFSI